MTGRQACFESGNAPLKEKHESLGWANPKRLAALNPQAGFVTISTKADFDFNILPRARSILAGALLATISSTSWDSNSLLAGSVAWGWCRLRASSKPVSSPTGWIQKPGDAHRATTLDAHCVLHRALIGECVRWRCPQRKRQMFRYPKHAMRKP